MMPKCVKCGRESIAGERVHNGLCLSCYLTSDVPEEKMSRASDTKRMKELEAICADCDKDPEDRDGDPCEYCKTWEEIKSLEKHSVRMVEP